MELYYHYIIHFVISLIVGGFFCLGLWNSRDGADSIKPNGEKTTDWAMIFYPITRFLSKTRENVIYYIDDELYFLFDRIDNDFRQFSDLLDLLTLFEKRIIINEDITKEQRKLLKYFFADVSKRYKSEGIEFEIGTKDIRPYKIYEVPIFNEYLTKPLWLCYKCYASIWGTIIFILSTSFAIHTKFIPFELWVLIPMLVLYCFSLVVVNIYIEKKIR